MRPAHVFAKPAADDELQIAALLQNSWRFVLRLAVIWLSLRGLTAAKIAALFEYDPRTVRRWINRYKEEGVVVDTGQTGLRVTGKAFEFAERGYFPRRRGRAATSLCRLWRLSCHPGRSARGRCWIRTEVPGSLVWTKAALFAGTPLVAVHMRWMV